MSLDELNAAITEEYSDLGDSLDVDLDRETRNELAMLLAATGGDADELVHRAIHTLYRSTVDTGDLDFHLRKGFDVTYDEYLYGELEETYNQMGGRGASGIDQNDDRRYQQ